MNVAVYSEGTLTKIIDILDDYSHSKDEELASLLGVDIKEIIYFVIQFNIFDSMGSCCESKYVNYFYKINITMCELLEIEHEKDTFIKAIVVFIRGRMQERNKFRLTIDKKEDVELHIKILSQIPQSKNYLYHLDCNRSIDLAPLIRIANQIENIKHFSSIIYNNDIQIETKGKYFIEPALTESNIDTIVNYSKKHPNTIGRLRGKKNIKDKSKITELIEYNKDSIYYCHFKHINLYETCANISYLTIKGEFDDVAYYPKSVHFPKIKTIRVKVQNLKNPILISKIITIISACQNVLTIIFDNIHFEFGNAYEVFPILMNINVKELRKM